MWQALGTRYRVGYAGLRDGALVCLGPKVPPDVLDDLGTRMILSRHGAPGQGRQKAAAGCRRCVNS